MLKASWKKKRRVLRYYVAALITLTFTAVVIYTTVVSLQTDLWNKKHVKTLLLGARTQP